MLRIGVDIGGTNIKLAVVKMDDSPGIAARDIFLFEHVSCDVLCRRIFDHSLNMLENIGRSLSDLELVGVSVPGSIDQSESILLHAYNMGYHNVPLKAELSKLFGDIPIRMINDANAAALAEYHAGALKGCDTSILLTLGTGLGFGLILNGKLFNGGQNRGAEAGHLPFRNGDRPCTCGLSGCLECYTSANWIIQQAREKIGPRIENARQLIELAKEGDKAANDILDEYIENLSTIVAGLCNTFDPQRIAIGGGISASGDILFSRLEELVEKKNFFRAHYDIVPAHYLNDAGVIGAVLE